MIPFRAVIACASFISPHVCSLPIHTIAYVWSCNVAMLSTSDVSRRGTQPLNAVFWVLKAIRQAVIFPFNGHVYMSEWTAFRHVLSLMRSALFHG